MALVAPAGQPQFPPNGATINYYLSAVPSGPLSLDILDAAGKVVRSVSSEGRRACSPTRRPSSRLIPTPKAVAEAVGAAVVRRPAYRRTWA